MKIRIEIIETLEEEEIIIKCAGLNETVQAVHDAIMEHVSVAPKLTFQKDGHTFYFPIDEVLFFETNGEYVYAHTEQETYRTQLRLYEVEEIAPNYFMRISKSAVVNTRQIYAIERNLASASLARFRHSHKEVYVSRHYYKALKERMEGRNLK
ncbi:MAG: LytTR family DNA-binding domain-containing protein [Christensenellaceae bacterium]|jgi:DNA-binding LytR/AlgR family response regulator